jgi:hypothetical protein
VIATTPAVGTIAQPTAVVLTENPADSVNAARCSSRTDYVHWSINGATIVSKGWVTCNYAGTVSVTMTLWRCADAPSPAETALTSGAWGCAIGATTAAVRSVTPGVESLPVYVPDSGAPTVPGGAYFIAATKVPGALTSWSLNPQTYIEPQ